MEKETINAKIRNQLTPIVNLIELIKLCNNTNDKELKTKYENRLFECVKSAEHSVDVLCSFGYNKYEDE